jgi:hypothetical protein
MFRPIQFISFVLFSLIGIRLMSIGQIKEGITFLIAGILFGLFADYD